MAFDGTPEVTTGCGSGSHQLCAFCLALAKGINNSARITSNKYLAFPIRSCHSCERVESHGFAMLEQNELSHFSLSFCEILKSGGLKSSLIRFT